MQSRFRFSPDPIEFVRPVCDPLIANPRKIMSRKRNQDASMPRRRFLQLSATTVCAVGGLSAAPATKQSTGDEMPASDKTSRGSKGKSGRQFNGAYAREFLEHVAFPLRGLGAGMICLEGG